MSVDSNHNTTQQPADFKDSADDATVNNIAAVTELRRKEAEEKAKLAGKQQQEDIEKIQKQLKNNKLMFYGLPILVVVYGFLAIYFAVVPAIQSFFSVDQSLQILHKNGLALKATADNLSAAQNKLDLFDKYNQEITSYIPSDSQLGSIITVIQTKAGDFGLESRVALPNKDAVSQNSTVNDISSKDQNDNALFDSINSGEIEFTPEGVSGDAQAKLLAFDVNVQGGKDNFFKFVQEMESAKPIINLVFIDFQDAGSDATTGEQKIRATLRFESYTLKLAQKNTQVKKMTINDPSLLIPMTEDTFDLDPAIVAEFNLGSN